MAGVSAASNAVQCQQCRQITVQDATPLGGADGLQRTVANEEVRRQFTNVGTVPAFDGPTAFTDFMARDIERNVALLRPRSSSRSESEIRPTAP
jgi:hypothetical protein